MSPQELQQSLEGLIERTQAIDIREYEEVAVDQLPALVQNLVALLSEATSIFSFIVEHYGQKDRVKEPSASAGGESATFYRDVDQTLAHLSGAERLANLSFMARWELQAKWDGFGRFRFGDDRWTIVAECGSARRRIVKSSIAVETALSEHEGLPGKLRDHYVTELERSLQIRQAYAQLRREMVSLAPSASIDITESLRRARVALAVLVERDAYIDMRVSDRVALRVLTDRVVKFLRTEEKNLEQAAKLWAEVESFTELLVAVNKRAELIEHDRTVIRLARKTLLSVDNTKSLSDALFRKLQALEGRDGELDEMLLDPGDRPIGEWRESLERLAVACHCTDERRDSQDRKTRSSVPRTPRGKQMATKKRDGLEDKLGAALDRSADIQGAAVLGKDGLLIASTFDLSGHDATRVGAEGAALFGLSSRTLDSLNAGQFEQVVLQGDSGMAVVAKAGEQSLILALVRRNSNLGMALLEIRKLADVMGMIDS